MSKTEINSTVKKLRKLKRKQDELQAEIDSLQNAIKAEMTACDVDILTGADWKITWKTVTSSRVDTTALKRELPDLVARFTKTSTSRRFCLL